MHCLLPLVKSKDNIFPDVFFNTLSTKVILENCYSVPRVQHLYHSTMIYTYIGRNNDKNIPHNWFFFHFLFRIKETLKNWHFVNSLVSLSNTDFSSAKWPHQLFQIAYFSTFRTSQATNTGTLVNMDQNMSLLLFVVFVILLV